jgi:hypothetical protein
MSANIYWRPTDVGKTGVNTNAPSRFMDILAEVTGQRPPLVLRHEHLASLRALARAEPGEGSWSQLVKALEQHDEIDITAEY